MPKLRVLFVCIGNSARSQMGEAWLRLLAGDRFEAASGGTAPIPVRAQTIEVMAEVGGDLSKAVSRHVDDVPGPFDYVITTCAEAEADCPNLRGTLGTVHWHIPDPVMPAMNEKSESAQLAIYRRARERVKAKVEEFLKDHPA